MRVMGNERLVSILYELDKNQSMSYNEMLKFISTRSNIFAYYLRNMVSLGLVKKEYNIYFLTRIGLQTLRLYDSYKKIVMNYNLLDIKADGIVQFEVIGRKL